MSTIRPGSLGQFRGKIGTVVVAKWRGIYTGRSTPGKSTKPASKPQMDQRKKFGTISSFLKYFSKEIAVGWASAKPKKTAMNEAVDYHFDHALLGTYPEYQFNYEALLISRGRGIIDGGFRPVAVATAEESVNISWVTSNSTSDITQPTDQLTVVFFDENIRPGRFGVTVNERIAERRELNVNVDVPFVMMGHPLHVYLFFVSEDGKLASRSEYLGIVTIFRS
ncbi:DUF6266 family protein [Pedobacter sp. MC2016-15]|uniref:DUF6266 family protein n=1 Tax=Pedobacter sp. MC2016-15 TaxID=2994473 RepID=UPI002247FEBD|nr:DUF6266 family protein [Pedobacter sp. MC2016-15]MCX2481841.1 DUF6266 family protein [Pedobacter sp. MC2016-15]